MGRGAVLRERRRECEERFRMGCHDEDSAWPAERLAIVLQGTELARMNQEDRCATLQAAVGRAADEELRSLSESFGRICFGKHEDRTLVEVVRPDAPSIQWATGACNFGGPLADFQVACKQVYKIHNAARKNAVDVLRVQVGGILRALLPHGHPAPHCQLPPAGAFAKGGQRSQRGWRS